jgi:hypothetical protein
LVATAAHVAEAFRGRGSLFAVLEGRSEQYPITKTWFHPRLKRELDLGLLAVSFDPRDGPIASLSSDVAVVQIGDDSDPLLIPGEIKIDRQGGPPKQGTQAGFIGYCGQPFSPECPRGARALFRVESIVGAPESINRFAGALSNQESQLWKASASGDYSGCSGGPTFLEDGRIFGIITYGSKARNGSETPPFVAGTCIEAIHELLFFYGLDRLMPSPLKSVSVVGFQGPDPRLPEYRLAMTRVREARRLRQKGRYSSAVEICNGILVQTPHYGGALLERSKSYLYFVATHWGQLSAEDRKKYVHLALEDSGRCIEVFSRPDEVVRTGQNYARIINFQNIIFDSVVCSDRSGFQFVLARTAELLRSRGTTDELTSHERAFVFNLRAQACQFLGDSTEARRGYDESIKIEPTVRRWYLNRARDTDGTRTATRYLAHMPLLAVRVPGTVVTSEKSTPIYPPGYPNRLK